MALKSTVYRIALHPPETEERLMMRVLAQALNAPGDDTDEPPTSGSTTAPVRCCSGSRSAIPTNAAWRAMPLHVTVQDGMVWVGEGERPVELHPQSLALAA